jgi:hypothetical protein
MKKFKSLLITAGIILMGFVLIQPGLIGAEEIGSTIETAITFTASEDITAADFTVSVSGGTLTNLDCGGAGFSVLTSTDTNCVIYNTEGATSGTIATATVSADTAGTLTVSATGTMSTAEGVEPSSSSFNGGTYTITDSSQSATNTPTPTPTSRPNATATPAPTTRSTNTPTPVASNLPRTGTTANTITFAFLTGILLFAGIKIARLENK